MKSSKLFVLVSCAAALGLILAACAAPMNVRTFSKGTITAKGSIFVNGVEYDDSKAAITVNGAAAADADLKVGMHVEVSGNTDAAGSRGAADTVESNNSFEGPISALSASTITVLAQTVKVDASTSFEAPLTGIGSLAVGNVIDVAAYASGSAAFTATHLETSTAAMFEIDGVVGSMAAGSFTLTPQGGVSLTVSYTGTLAASIVTGALVEVKFATFTPPLTVNADAAGIALKSELQPAEGDLVQVEGYVASLSGQTFVVDGIAVNAGTLPLGSLANGTKVEVTGTFTAGVLMASTVQVK